ncbi:CHASE2 domain-containing protein [Stenomitos frigidus]|uniref:Adenylate/guanylate cyclase domain-containing protein n=1 Tax=Stenomitos frigidus ULC18 TaxID=2107698 RepID=A0A2T1E9V9_9CYAN|nr:adenylate/guanylate cyclase domain-containing protein [Stenomitos frigidus]PSB29536.1 adenylate/guanylate cyclase domain-containing protein [Stenomitos frigidus ULC18]
MIKGKRRWAVRPATIAPLCISLWAVTGAIATAFNLQPFQLLELQSQTLFFRLRGSIAPPQEIVILAIDDDSLTQGRDFKDSKTLAAIQSWPWRRTAYAEAINKLMAAGARSVAIDVLWDLPSDRPADDQRLRETLQRYAGRVTLASQHATSQSDGGGLEQFVNPDPSFQFEPQSIGFINYLAEPDGQLRRFASAYLNRIDADLRRSQPNLRSFDEASLQASKLPFVPPKGDYIFFYGGQNTFTTVSFWHVLHPQNWALLKQQQMFKDKIVLIGPTAAFLQDHHPTPFGEVSGVEIHANAIATVLENQALAEAVPDPLWRGLYLLFGVAGIGIAIGQLSKRATPRFLLAIAVAGAWLLVGHVSFAYAGFILPVVTPMLAIALSGLSYLGTGAVSDQLEKLRLRRTLERYVATPIVNEILNQPEDFQALLQGRKLNAAVLFCDIRGFTSLSYKLPPEELIALLNAYLNAMVEAIATASGTIDKFIGDAVMAEFGSPVSYGEQADAMNAIRAALGMRRLLAALRSQWQQEGKTLLYHGIGISYGEVIAGNIGSLRRLEYTVIGDTVNVASRVEGLTKSFRTDILITESLYQLVQEHVEVIFVGEHLLRGREDSPTRLYSLVGLRGEPPTLYHQVHEELCRYLDYQQSRT